MFHARAQEPAAPNLEEINISDTLNKEAPSDEVAKDLEALNSDTFNDAPKASEAPEINKVDEMDVTDSFTKTAETPAVESAPVTTPTPTAKTGEAVKMSTLEEQDDLQSLKEDVGEVVFEKKEVPGVDGETKVSNLDFETSVDDEKLLKDLASQVKKKMPNADWWELSHKEKPTTYEVQKGEDLLSISKKLFGTDSYYAKIWALNPQIINPYDVEAGTILSFDLGSIETPPNLQVGEFASESDLSAQFGSSTTGDEKKDRPDWIKERKKLIDQGIYFQFASEETYDDLVQTVDDQKIVEYENYSPPSSQFSIVEPSSQYDDTGFDKNSKIVFNVKEGFFLNSFVTTNMVQDLGEVTGAINEGVYLHKHDTIYVAFDKKVKVKPGDLFSVYNTGGEIKHKISDRTGFVYTTTAQIKVMKNIENDVWQCYITDQSGIVQRKDRITVHTPQIGKIIKTFSQRKVEAAIIGSYRDSSIGLSFGDVVYLDRGRADGLELGNTLEVFSFVDRGTEKKISTNPAYKIGELNIINLTDNFATAVISVSSHEINVGAIAFAKTQEDHIRSLNKTNKDKSIQQKDGKALEELDVELNLSDVNEDILNKADKVQLSEDEIEELDRQERDKSVIKEKERDVKELDRLESEILDAEKSLHESKVDEDKFLEQQDLDSAEKKTKSQDPNAFESINEIEKDIGKKYLDEDLNNKENPFGLTEYDLEEVDLLLNTGSKK